MDRLKRHSKSIVGVTGPDKGGGVAWVFTQFAVWRSGGKAQRITPSRPRSIQGLDGLIIGGGADIDPGLYAKEKDIAMSNLHDGQRISWAHVINLLLYPLLYLIRKVLSTREAVMVDKKRDALEYGLIKEALKRQIPILGICRGAQLLNIYFGGSLHQVLREFYSETPQLRSILPRKSIHIEPKSKLARILKTTRCKVNALNRQAIKTLGVDVVATAHESNTIIQAIEHTQFPFVIGVQWHPEYLPQQPRQRAIFDSLTKACHNSQPAP